MKPYRGVALRLALAQGASGLIGGAGTPFFGAWLGWKGLSPTEIGTLLSAGLLLRVAVLPMTGLIADARNDRRSVMIALYLVVTAGYLALNAVNTPLLLFVAAVPASVALGAVNPLLESVSVRLADRFGFDYGHVRLWASTAFVAGNVVAGACVSLFGLVVIAPWLAVAIILNVIAVYALPAAPTTRERGNLRVRMGATFAEAHELMRSRIFLLFLVAASFDQGSHALYYALGGLHWRALGYSGTLIGFIWPLGVLAEIALFSVSLKLFRRVGAMTLLIAGTLACAVRWTILAFDPPLPFVIVAQLLHGGTFALAHLGAMYFILKAVPPRLAATAQSLYAVCSAGLVMGLATYASGPLYAAFGGRAYLLMSAMGCVALIFAVLLARSWSGARITQSVSEEALDTI
ncbi:MAG: MFS transporter [Rhizomicrobium sp.]|jgi:PPP family 3-phenylpropionic acid transporter